MALDFSENCTVQSAPPELFSLSLQDEAETQRKEKELLQAAVTVLQKDTTSGEEAESPSVQRDEKPTLEITLDTVEIYPCAVQGVELSTPAASAGGEEGESCCWVGLQVADNERCSKTTYTSSRREAFGSSTEGEKHLHERGLVETGFAQSTACPPWKDIQHGEGRKRFAAEGFYKTKMCRFFEKGQCKYGAHCRYAHAQSEVRQALNLRKTRLCALYRKGQCNSTDCSFAHGHAELRSTDNLFKTQLCLFWLAQRCRAGGSCRHAHGANELVQRPSRLPLLGRSLSDVLYETPVGAGAVAEGVEQLDCLSMTSDQYESLQQPLNYTGSSYSESLEQGMTENSVSGYPIPHWQPEVDPVHGWDSPSEKEACRLPSWSNVDARRSESFGVRRKQQHHQQRLHQKQQQQHKHQYPRQHQHRPLVNGVGTSYGAGSPVESSPVKTSSPLGFQPTHLHPSSTPMDSFISSTDLADSMVPGNSLGSRTLVSCYPSTAWKSRDSAYSMQTGLVAAAPQPIFLKLHQSPDAQVSSAQDPSIHCLFRMPIGVPVGLPAIADGPMGAATAFRTPPHEHWFSPAASNQALGVCSVAWHQQLGLVYLFPAGAEAVEPY